MRIKKLLCACLIALVLAACCSGALAKVPSPSKEFYFLDQADVLSEATEGEIYFSNQLLNEACGAQIVVVTVNSTGSEALDDYTNELFNSWGIGSKEAQNGFLLVLAIKDDDYYAVCGDNLQPKFTASALKVYFDKYLEKDFAAKRYDAGVKKFFEAVFSRISDTYNANVTVEQGVAAYQEWAGQADAAPMSARSGGGMPSGAWDEGDGYGLIVLITIILILIVVLVNVMRRRRFRRTVLYDAVPPPPPPVGEGGYRGVNSAVGPGGYRGVSSGAGPGGYRGPAPRPTRTDDGAEWLMRGILHGMLRSGGGFHPSGGSSRSSRSSGGGFRSSGSSHSSGGSRSFGGGHGGGGHTSGGGAGRGRH